MKVVGAVVLCFACLFACQCAFSKEILYGLGKTASEVRPVGQFEKIVIEGPVDVFLKQGDDTRLEIEADDNIIELVTTEVKNNTLSIDLDKPSNYRGIKTRKDIKVFVTVPQVTNMRINGSGNITGDGQWDFQNMEIYIAGSGDVTMSLNGKKLDVSVYGSGNVVLDGIVVHQKIKISGSGNYNARKLRGETAVVNVTGSGDVTLDVSSKLDVQIFGSGNVRYKGSPQVNIQVHGSGSVTKL